MMQEQYLQSPVARRGQATLRHLKPTVLKRAEAYPSVSGVAGHPPQALPLLIDMILQDSCDFRLANF